MYKNIHIKHW